MASRIKVWCKYCGERKSVNGFKQHVGSHTRKGDIERFDEKGKPLYLAEGSDEASIRIPESVGSIDRFELALERIRTRWHDYAGHPTLSQLAHSDLLAGMALDVDLLRDLIREEVGNG